MIVPRNTRPEVAVSRASSPPALTHVYLRGDFLEATDSFIAVQVPVVRQDGDRDGAIPTLAFSLAREYLGGEGTASLDLSKEKTIGVPGLAGLNRPFVAKKPPSYEELKAKFAGQERPHRVAINTAHLQRLAMAIGADIVVLEFTGTPTDPVRVIANEPETGGEGFIMPLRSTMSPPPIPDDDEEQKEKS